MTGPRVPTDGTPSDSASAAAPRNIRREPPRLPAVMTAEERARRLAAPPPRRPLPMPPPVPAAHPLPQLPADVLDHIVRLADTRQLNTLRKVNHRFHRVANRRIESMFLSIVENNAARLGFDGCPIGGHDEPLFRGDERPPGAVFGLGFTKFNDDLPHVSGELVRGVVSTSRDAGIVRRKYGFVGGYVYALSGVPGIDTLNRNKLEEVATFFVPPECVIAAIGPIEAIDHERYVLVVNDPAVIDNPNCRQPAEVVALARAALRELCRAPDD